AAGLPEIVRSLAVRSTELPALDRHLAPDIVRGEQSLDHTAVTCRLLRRDLERDGGKPSAPAWAGRKRGGPFRQGAKSPALPVEYIYLAYTPVGIRIKLDLGLARAACGVIRNIDDPGGATNSERRGRRRDRHVAVLGHQAGNKCDCATCDVEYG